MRRLFTTGDAATLGISPKALRLGDGKKWVNICRSVYGEGPEPASAIDRARAEVLVTRGVASGSLAGLHHGLDSVRLCGPFLTVAPHRSGRRPGAVRRALDPRRVMSVQGLRCTDGLQTMIDLAVLLDDLGWEQAFESALRKGLLLVEDLEAVVPDLSASRMPGIGRIRRVLALRPPGARPTESLLETRAIQMMRHEPRIPEPIRQLEIFDEYGQFVARTDLGIPDPGAFIELDGEQHKDQPVYDAQRQTAIVAATGMLPARATWTDVVRLPRSTNRRILGVVDQARQRRRIL